MLFSPLFQIWSQVGYKQAFRDLHQRWTFMLTYFCHDPCAFTGRFFTTQDLFFQKKVEWTFFPLFLSLNSQLLDAEICIVPFYSTSESLFLDEG